MSHAANHAKRDPLHRRNHHRHTGAKQGAAAAAFGAAAAAGAVPLAEGMFGQERTREMAEQVIGKLPKDMLTGLAIGFAVGGLAGAWVLRSSGSCEGYAQRRQVRSRTSLRP